MGLPAHGKDVVNSWSDELILQLRKRYNATNRGIFVRLLEERLAAPEAGEDFKRSFVLYVMGTLLCPTARLDLVREISHFRQGKQRAVGGCLLFLQLLYYESVAVGAAYESAPVAFPCLFSWGEEEISEREKQEKELGGYGSGEDLEDQEYEDTFTKQCENGHIACASCCIKVANKCPSCRFPIGHIRCRAMEKVIESAKVSCVNKRYGCKEILSYTKKTEHENACMYVPCSCPFHGCDFVGTSTKLYAHFSDKHASSAERIFFNAVHPIYIEKDQSYQFLQIWTEGMLFIINHARGRVGSAINIICVGPAMQKRRFSYELVVRDGESSFKLESIAESIPNWSKDIPLKNFLLVPKHVVNSSTLLKLDVLIADVDVPYFHDVSAT